MMPTLGLQFKNLQPRMTPDAKVDRFMPLSRGPLVNRFIRFQNVLFTSLATDERRDGRMNERTDGQHENSMPPPASLTWRRCKNATSLS